MSGSCFLHYRRSSSLRSYYVNMLYSCTYGFETCRRPAGAIFQECENKMKCYVVNGHSKLKGVVLHASILPDLRNCLSLYVTWIALTRTLPKVLLLSRTNEKKAQMKAAVCSTSSPSMFPISILSSI